MKFIHFEKLGSYYSLNDICEINYEKFGGLFIVSLKQLGIRYEQKSYIETDKTVQVSEKIDIACESYNIENINYENFLRLFKITLENFLINDEKLFNIDEQIKYLQENC